MWYEERGGLQFECTRCGHCCKRPGVVALNDDDLTRIATTLGLTQQELCDRLLRRRLGRWVLSVREGGACVFLGESGCMIHEDKPLQCRAYPFWPEVLESPQSWDAEATQCEGMGQGALHTPEQIEAARLRDDE